MVKKSAPARRRKQKEWILRLYIAGYSARASATLVRRLPQAIKRIIGDLSNAERVLVGLDLRPRVRAPRVGV